MISPSMQEDSLPAEPKGKPIVALKYFVGFCHTSTLISHRYTHVHSLRNPLHLPPYPTSLDCHRALSLNSLGHIANSDWLSVLHMVMHTFLCYSCNLSHSLLPTLLSQVCFLSLYLHCCPGYRFISYFKIQ